MHQIEPLEVRIAPATLLPAEKGLTYTDVDGDVVTLKTTLPVQSFQFRFDTPFDTEGPQQLKLIDFIEGSVGTFSVTMTVKRGPEGDGLANVGALITDEDMENITIKGDLGRLVVGDSNPDRQGLKTLNVNSLGALGTSTQLSGGTLESSIFGGAGSIKVRGDVFSEVNILAVVSEETGKVGSIAIGGSLIGGSADSSGRIFIAGDIGSVTVKGDVRGGGGLGSGRINAGGSIGKVVIGGSLLGNSGGSAGSQFADAFSGSGSISAGLVSSLVGSIKSVTIGGDMHGDSGTGSGSIFSSLGEGSIGSVTVKGSIIGGTGAYSGAINTEHTLDKLTVGGSIVGNSGYYNRGEDAYGQVWAGGNVGKVKITGDVIGGLNTSSGRIASGASITSLSIGGSLVVGNGFLAGSIGAADDLGKVSIKRNMDGRDNVSGFNPIILASNINSLTIGGFVNGLIIAATQQVGAVTIGGSLVSSQIYSVGEENAEGTDIAIKSVKVKGSVIQSNILGGYLWNVGWMFGNADAQIGSITVRGDWIASSLSAGVNATDAFYGDSNDALATVSDDPTIISRIASIAIAGQVIGTTVAGDHFGFVAQQIGKFKVGGFPVKLEADEGNDVIELSLVTGDVTIRELPTL